MRRRLELYFQRRNCSTADELADETLNRVARRLDEEGTISAVSPTHYCYVVARLVFHEYLRRVRPIADLSPDDSAVLRRAIALGEHGGDVSEQMLERLEQCLMTLPPEDRELIVEYYRGEQRAKIDRRRQLAAQRGMTVNALSIRACRLREKLEACIRARLEDR